MRVCVFVLALLMSVANAADRPRVGLVLSGGGARGVAHLGVLRVLEEMRIPVDCIVGTSMGALVGGAYAAGVPVEEIVSQVEHTDWNTLFTDEPARTEKPYRAKRDDYLNLFRPEFGLRDYHVLLPTGVVSGYKFEFFLRTLTARAGNYSSQPFDALPIPFRSVGANLEKGTMTVFGRGDLVKAMRASMSVPGAIAPVEVKGVLYVDGGLLRNLPVDVARATCAGSATDVVIAVNLGSPLLPRSELTSLITTYYQSYNLLTEQNVSTSLAELTPNDVLIEPELGGFSFADFENAARITIPIGEAAARKSADALRRLAVSEDAWRAWKAHVAARVPQPPPVSRLKVATDPGRVSAEVIDEELKVLPGVTLWKYEQTGFSLENLHRRLTQIYGSGDFERMDYRFLDADGARTIEVRGIEKSWGPHYLKVGLGLATDGDSTRAEIVASQRSTWLNDAGAEWRNDISVGYHHGFRSEFLQPLNVRYGAFVAPRVELSDEPIVFYSQGSRIGDYRVRYSRAHLDLGWQNQFGEVRAGVFRGVLKADADFGVVVAVPDVDVRQAGYEARIMFDQLDNIGVPRNGVMVDAHTFGTLASMGSEDEYNRTTVSLIAARSFGDHTLQIGGFAGLDLGKSVPAYDPYRLGGLLKGSGYRFDELAGREEYLGRLVYTYRVASLPPPLGNGLFVGGSLESIVLRRALDPTRSDGAQFAGSLFAAADTFLGPVYVGWGKAQEGSSGSRFYLVLGSR